MKEKIILNCPVCQEKAAVVTKDDPPLLKCTNCGMLALAKKYLEKDKGVLNGGILAGP